MNNLKSSLCARLFLLLIFFPPLRAFNSSDQLIPDVTQSVRAAWRHCLSLSRGIVERREEKKHRKVKTSFVLLSGALFALVSRDEATNKKKSSNSNNNLHSAPFKSPPYHLLSRHNYTGKHRTQRRSAPQKKSEATTTTAVMKMWRRNKMKTP